MKAPYAEKHYNIMNFNKSCSFEGKNFHHYMIFLSLTARLETNVSLILLLLLFFCLDDYVPFRVEKSNFCQETCKKEREKPKAKSQGNEGGSGNSVVRNKNHST